MSVKEDPFAKWRASLEGKKPPMHADEPWCGYYRIRDRRGLNAQLAAIKRPWIACAIWVGSDGTLKAERAGTEVDVDTIWPYCAKYPISYETYQFWHQNERWPEEADAA